MGFLCSLKLKSVCFQITIIPILLLFCCKIKAQSSLNIIPKPQSLVMRSGVFSLTESTPVHITSHSLKDMDILLRHEILKKRGLALSYSDQKKATPSIILDLDKGIEQEGYRLLISPKEIKISAANKKGIGYGISSLLQIVFQSLEEKKINIPSLEIVDLPVFRWRGLMIDVSRYFVNKSKIKEIIDWMYFYKLNRLHLHLTDEPGWRIEIKKYPLLALIGGIGDYNNPVRPAQYYTQQDIKEIVAYAAKRNIEVVPEIDMPGHATAANRAYPEFSGGGSERHPEFTFNPGKNETYTYLTNILKEVNVLFPSGMIHLGGDEVSYGNQKWTSNKEVQALMKKQQLRNLKDVEYYFMERMADSLYKMDVKLLAWDELAGSQLPPDKTILFWWRHDKPEQLNKALEKNFSVIVCPRIPFYFDFVQDKEHNFGRKWDGKFSGLEEIYNFSVDDLLKNKSYKSNIFGIQANLWTETITNDRRLEFMLFPRIAALAESAWTQKRNDFKEFTSRIQKHLEFYTQQNLYYYNPTNPAQFQEPTYSRPKSK